MGLWDRRALHEITWERKPRYMEAASIFSFTRMSRRRAVLLPKCISIHIVLDLSRHGFQRCLASVRRIGIPDR